MDKDKWIFTDGERNRFIDALTDELSVLRAKASISQDELAKLVGISRQTYGAIERKTRRMSWNTYLSLILFFDYTESTHEMIRNVKAIPPALINDTSKEESENLEQEEILDAITNSDKWLSSMNGDYINVSRLDKLSFLKYGFDDVNKYIDLELLFNCLDELILEGNETLTNSRLEFVNKRVEDK